MRERKGREKAPAGGEKWAGEGVEGAKQGKVRSEVFEAARRLPHPEARTDD